MIANFAQPNRAFQSALRTEIVTGLLLWGAAWPAATTAQAIAAPPLLPAASYVDVPQAPLLAVPNDGLDDTQTIQAAINATAARANKPGRTHQQIVYLAPREYLVSDTLTLSIRPNKGKMEHYQWLRGAGPGQTIIRLGRAVDSGRVLGAAREPRPVVQIAKYRKEKVAPGSINFLLWATDLSIGGIGRVTIQADESRPDPIPPKLQSYFS